MALLSDNIPALDEEYFAVSTSKTSLRDAIERVEKSSAEFAQIHLESIIHDAIQKQGGPLIANILRNVVLVVFITIGVYGAIYEAIIFGMLEYYPGTDSALVSMGAHGAITIFAIFIFIMANLTRR